MKKLILFLIIILPLTCYGQRKDRRVNNNIRPDTVVFQDNTKLWTAPPIFYYSQNLSIGKEAFSSYAGTSSANIFIGDYSGKYNTTGLNNTCVGFGALSSIQTGNTNNAIGWGALSILTTGQNNIAIGAYAGNFLISGNGNVFIGHKAGYYETGSNKLYISNWETTTPLIYGDFSNNTLTLGTTWNLKSGGSTSIPNGQTYQVNNVPINSMVRDSIQSNAAYGERHLLVGGVETITTPTTATTYNVTSYTATNILKDVTTATNGGLQVSTPGTYLVFWNIKLETGHINAVGISVNGTRNNDSESDVYNYNSYISGQKIVQLNASDIVRMTITTDNQTQVDITLKGSCLVLRKLIN